MEGLAGKITSSLHESNFACYNCIHGITSTADEYTFTSYNCVSNIAIYGRTVEEECLRKEFKVAQGVTSAGIGVDYSVSCEPPL